MNPPRRVLDLQTRAVEFSIITVQFIVEKYLFYWEQLELLCKNVFFRELSSVESSDPRLVYFTHVR